MSAQWWAIALAVAGGLVLLVVVLRHVVVPKLSKPPANLGLGPGGKLAPCPKSPNCVSTQADPSDRVHYFPPVALELPLEEARRRVLAALRSLPGETRVERDDGNYLHATSRSPFWRFVDDVEVYFDVEAKLVHFRSASRLGYGDFGQNRKRVARLVVALLK
ncbi:MAG: hypothetical protein Kow0069_28490 [Promethearchaeota archaeon]